LLHYAVQHRVLQRNNKENPMTSIAEEYAAKKAGKPPLQKLDPEFLIEMANVCGFGDNKHKDTHWTQGLPWSEVLGAVKRHIAAFELGSEINVDDGGNHHLAHAATGLMFLFHYARHADRYGHLNDLRFFPRSTAYNSSVVEPK
jgi:hypothetical protein